MKSSLNNMRSLVLFCVVAFFAGCETGMGSSESVSPWTSFNNGLLSHRLHTGYDGNGNVSNAWADLRNDSTMKLHVWGVLVSREPAIYIDRHQPGAFDLILYPGEVTTMNPQLNDENANYAYWQLGGCEIAQ